VATSAGAGRPARRLAEHGRHGRQLALLLSGPRRLHRLEDAGGRDARRLADRLDLAPALHEAHAIEDRIEILDADLRRPGLDVRDEGRFPRHPPVPGIGGREPLVAIHRPRRVGAERFAAVRRIDRSSLAPDRVEGGGELITRHDRLDPGERTASSPGTRSGPSERSIRSSRGGRNSVVRWARPSISTIARGTSTPVR
jgi:hypothetical protein